MIETPAELAHLRHLTTGIPAYGLVNSSLLNDQKWIDRWLVDSVLWVARIDQSLHTFVTRHCSHAAEVRYSTSTIRDESRILNFLCFFDSLRG